MTGTIVLSAQPVGSVDVQFDPVTRNVYVVNIFSGTMSVISEAADQVTATISDPRLHPAGSVAIDPAIGTVFVTNAATNSVAVIDEASSSVTQTVPAGSAPGVPAADPVTGNVYVPNTNDGTVSVINMTPVPVTSHFVWTATAANTSGDSTYINKSATNGRPGAILFVTPNWDRGGVCGCVYDPAPLGVWYSASAGKWAIFNDNQSPMPAGASFNVLVVPRASSSVFVQTATAGNSGGDSTFINTSLTNGQPGARLMVTQVWNPAGTGGIYNAHPVGVWYDNSTSRWAIFQEDQAAMPRGVSFDVMVGTASSGGGTSALQTATTVNIGGDSTFIANSNTTGNPNAVVFETPNWNPNGSGGTYDRPAAGVWWSDSTGQAAVFNEDHSAMPLNAAFNLIIYPG